MTLFVISALVALLGSAFCTVQVNAYMREYEKRANAAVAGLQRRTPDAVEPADAPYIGDDRSSEQRPALGYGLSPDVIHSWFDRVADLASNFPAVVLTIVAFDEVEPFKSRPLLVSLLAVGLVALSLFALYRTGPTRSAPKGLRIKVGSAFRVTLSYWTLLLFGLNLAGVGVVIFVTQDAA